MYAIRSYYGPLQWAMPVRKSLLPTDGLGKCAYGTCHGILLAKDLDAKITAVHVTGKFSAHEILEMYHPESLVGRSDVNKAKEAFV